MSKKSVRPKEILALLHRQGFKCAYTGDPLAPETVSADHIVPASRGGGHGIENIAMVSRAVNMAKGTSTVDEFREMCTKVVSHLGKKEVAQSSDSPCVISGCDDPVEILAKLGYVEAAAKCQEAFAKIRRLEEYRKKIGWTPGQTLENLDDKMETKIKKLQEVQNEINRQQIRLSALKSRAVNGGISLPFEEEVNAA